ncbi:hypothetical protein SADUNF_Sadunf16G0208500 [Salix dunnii]|uniref:Sulfite oxidase n=1 Tax=Salix dunnii TaxID=1413687 RepID=A0A835JFG4_9ROSI|nr:hypothetical protein SADUNF_Sadunf16G0208500 [Salix dunnii]
MTRLPPPSVSLHYHPFNAEPPRSALIASYITPVDFFYKRNHGPIPVVDDIERLHSLILVLLPCLHFDIVHCRNNLSVYSTNMAEQILCFDSRMLPKYNVTATLQCAGNRRTAMSKVKTVKGVGWDVSAIGNGVWGGAKLADVLELVGISKLTSSTKSGGKHVEFVSIDKCKEENGGPYKASIPLSRATNPDADVLVAYEMNGEPLNRDHGYPLRVVVPGVIGARSVKWLDCINIIAEESQGFFMQKDYKMFSPSVNWDNIDWSTSRPQMDFPVQSAICSLEDVTAIKPGKVKVSGYAASGGGRGIDRVDVSVDGGKTWVEASRYQKPGVHYISDDMNGDKWAWVLFDVTVDVPRSTEIVVKAVDSAANVQPENVQEIWNLRGILNTSWHRVQVRMLERIMPRSLMALYTVLKLSIKQVPAQHLSSIWLCRDSEASFTGLESDCAFKFTCYNFTGCTVFGGFFEGSQIKPDLTIYVSNDLARLLAGSTNERSFFS